MVIETNNNLSRLNKDEIIKWCDIPSRWRLETLNICNPLILLNAVTLVFSCF